MAAVRTLFRCMISDGGRPAVGMDQYMLGPGIFDVEEVEGLVLPGRQGISIVRDDPARAPANYRNRAWPGGRSAHPMWEIASDALGDLLRYEPDVPLTKHHGFISPGQPMTKDAYAEALASTLDRWIVTIFPGIPR